jgi:hypothetical protein
MKTVSILLIICCIGNTIFCQQTRNNKDHFYNLHDTISIVIQNGKINKTPSIGYMPSRNVLKITVKNINPFLYNINMQEFQNDYLNEMKDVSQTLLDYKIGSLSLNFPEINNKIFNFLQTDKPTIKGQLDILSTKIVNLQKHINTLYYSKVYKFRDSLLQMSLPRFQDSINTYDYILADSILKRDELNKTLYNFKAVSSSEADKNSKNEKVDINIGIQQAFSLEVANYNNEISQLQKIFEFYQALKTQVYSAGLNDSTLVIIKKQLAGRYFSSLPYSMNIDSLRSVDLTFFIHDKLNKANEIYQKLQSIYTDFALRKGNVASENQLALTMINYLEWLAEERKKITLNALDNIITTTVLLYNAIDVNNFSYTFVIDDLKEKTDFIKYIFDASPKTNFQSAIIPKPIKYAVTMPVKGGIQMNVSSGFFFNFGLGNDEFYYKPVTDSSFEITKSNKSLRNTFLPSIGLMLHVYQRTYKSFKPAISIGFSTTNATDVKYYFGGSAILGKNQRWVLSAGICGGEKEVLKSNFGEGKEMLVSSNYKENHLEIETNKKFKVGGFVAFTFNLFGSSTKKFDFEAKGTNTTP